MFNRILVAVDGSDHGEKAVSYAADLAARYNAELIILHVVERVGSKRVSPELQDLSQIEHVAYTEAEAIKRHAEEILQDAQKCATSAGAPKTRTLLVTGEAAKLIVETATSEKADLVVLGRRGLSFMGSVLHGSVSHDVAHQAQFPCMTVF